MFQQPVRISKRTERIYHNSGLCFPQFVGSLAGCMVGSYHGLPVQGCVAGCLIGCAYDCVTPNRTITKVTVNSTPQPNHIHRD